MAPPRARLLPALSDRRICRMLICRNTNKVRRFRYVPQLISDVLPQYVWHYSQSIWHSADLAFVSHSSWHTIAGRSAVATASSKVVAYTRKTVPTASTPRSIVTVELGLIDSRVCRLACRLIAYRLLASKCSWRYSCELATPRR